MSARLISCHEEMASISCLTENTCPSHALGSAVAGDREGLSTSAAVCISPAPLSSRVWACSGLLSGCLAGRPVPGDAIWEKLAPCVPGYNDSVVAASAIA